MIRGKFTYSKFKLIIVLNFEVLWETLNLNFDNESENETKSILIHCSVSMFRSLINFEY